MKTRLLKAGDTWGYSQLDALRQAGGYQECTTDICVEQGERKAADGEGRDPYGRDGITSIDF
jgi:hypothetical protein